RHALVDAGLPTPPFAEVGDVAAVGAFADAHGGWPVVLKAARDGYDGKGVWLVDRPDAAAVVLTSLPEGVPAVVEPRLPLDRELAVLVARRPSGGSVVYPCVETRQVDGICHEVLLPAAVPSALAAEAEAVACGVADLAGAVGVLAVELFVVDGRVLVNELAPRPHNSGHLTIDACRTSQFENHLRAVLDWPLGSPDPVTPAAAMANLIAGDPALDPRDRVAAALAAGDVDVHVYDKTPRPGRKLGHVTALAPDRGTARSLALAASAALGSVVGPAAADQAQPDEQADEEEVPHG
ncbi:MAG: ATP-grasp domain-containing protein, partial [Acidimicrobiales bacterium]|nr:ATP-grasp domain-containing protein [Acidimicrobiales bacterium]